MNIEFFTGTGDRKDEIIDLFDASFSDSEGSDEGRIVATLARNLLETTNGGDLFVFSALKGGTLLASIVFSRVVYSNDKRSVFILSPVAVRTDQQGLGIGQALLSYGLTQLRKHGVDVAITYGNPVYYSKVGFDQITDAIARPPHPLGRPEGWLAQSLNDRPLGVLAGNPGVAPALDDPAYW